MKTATFTVVGVTPYGQSKFYDVEKLNKELSADYEKRTWRNRMHVDQNGMVYIPPMALKNALAGVAKWLGEQIQGQGKKTYTKRFEAGIVVTEPIALGIRAEDVPATQLFVPSDGIKGSGKRVMKYFPTITTWSGQAEVLILDEIISEDVFRRHLEEAGKFIGLGFFRPERGGFWGRFKVEQFKWNA